MPFRWRVVDELDIVKVLFKKGIVVCSKLWVSGENLLCRMMYSPLRALSINQNSERLAEFRYWTDLDLSDR